MSKLSHFSALSVVVSLMCFVSCSSSAKTAQKDSIHLDVVQAEIDDMRHELKNVASDLQMVSDRVNNQDSAQEKLQSSLSQMSQKDYQRMQNQLSELEKKYYQMESAQAKKTKEVQQVQAYAKELTASMEQYKQKMAQLEAIISKQQQSVDSRLTTISGAVENTLTNLQKGHSSSTATAAVVPATGKVDTHTVAKGESLGGIAKKYNTSVAVIKALNKLDNDKIFVGQNLKVPGNQQASVVQQQSATR